MPWTLSIFMKQAIACPSYRSLSLRKPPAAFRLVQHKRITGLYETVCASCREFARHDKASTMRIAGKDG